MRTFDYIVRAGDSYWKLAKDRYADAQAAEALESAVGVANLKAGETIKLPSRIDYPKPDPDGKGLSIIRAPLQMLDQAGKQPLRLFQSSPERPGLHSRSRASRDASGRQVPNALPADDMTFGDTSRHDYINIGLHPAIDSTNGFVDKSDDELFAIMTSHIDSLSMGDLQGCCDRAIAKFRDKSPLRTSRYNTRADAFQDDKLTQAALAHHATTEFSATAKARAEQKIVSEGMNLFKITSTETLNTRVIFADFADNFFGLGILVHDTWAYDVDLVNYTLVSDSRFSGVLKITVYDHFGLDLPDIQKFGIYDGFRAWYILQHVRGFIPFWTVFETTVNIEGSL